MDKGDLIAAALSGLGDGCLGHTSDDPLSAIFNTNVRRFESPHGIHGQYWTDGEPEVARLSLLTVVATQPRTGQLSRFIAACKEEFDSIGVYLIMNDGLTAALERWGFWPYHTVHDGEKLAGYFWKRDDCGAHFVSLSAD